MVSDKAMLKRLKVMQEDFDFASGSSSFFDPQTRKHYAKMSSNLEWAIKKLEKVVK